MVARLSFVLVCQFLLPFVTAIPGFLAPYAPKESSCPSSPLVRPGNALSPSETTYIANRKAKADASLKAWLTKVNAEFGTGKLPSVGLTTSGGGYRALLTGAGVVQGLDNRDSNVGTSGLYQGLTYHSGLSGGAWMLSSLAGNDWPSVSSLRDNLWGPAFDDNLLYASFLSNPTTFGPIAYDVISKNLAGFPPTLTDPWGRALSSQLLYGRGGGVDITLSSVTQKSNFKSFNVPYPIITALGVNTFEGDCTADTNGTQYELHPYEFGSWDSGVDAFADTKYLGSSLSNGSPTEAGACITNYDNLGYVLGTSSNLFNEATPLATNETFNGTLSSITSLAHELSTRDLYAVYPNPFYNYAASTLIAGQKELSLIDGGVAGQNNPIWPFLQPQRKVDVLLVTDSSSDVDGFPDGSNLQNTYRVSAAAGLAKMPEIPGANVFTAQRFNKRPTFFGCQDAAKLTIVYLPNTNYTFESNQSTFKLQYSKEETAGMIANGVQIATLGGDPEWPTCLACGIMKKSGEKLPEACEACIKKYCYN